MLFVKNFRIFLSMAWYTKSMAWYAQFQCLVHEIPMLGTETALEYYFKIKLRHIKIPLVSSHLLSRGTVLWCVKYLCLIFVLLLAKFLFRQTLFVNHAPSINDIGQDEGDDEWYPWHSSQGEMARTTISQCQRTLQICSGGIVGRVIVTHSQKQS